MRLSQGRGLDWPLYSGWGGTGKRDPPLPCDSLTWNIPPDSWAKKKNSSVACLNEKAVFILLLGQTNYTKDPIRRTVFVVTYNCMTWVVLVELSITIHWCF